MKALALSPYTANSVHNRAWNAATLAVPFHTRVEVILVRDDLLSVTCSGGVADALERAVAAETRAEAPR